MTKKELALKLGVSVSSLYYKPKRDQIDLEIKSQIESVLVDHPTYGHKRIALVLKLNKKRILRVMHKYNIKPYRRRSKRPIKKNDLKKLETVHKNLIKHICPIRPAVVWVSDFTYIKFHDKFIYLATIMDLYTRELVGSNISRYHNKELVLGALNDALQNHSPPQIVHSDQGSEYDCNEYDNLCNKLSIQISMSRKSSPWENAFQESFYSHYKLQIADVDRFDTLGELVEELYTSIHYYNYKRIHSSLKMTPIQFKELYYKKLGT